MEPRSSSSHKLIASLIALSIGWLGCHVEHRPQTEGLELKPASSNTGTSILEPLESDASAPRAADVPLEVVAGNDGELDPAVRAAYIRNAQLEGGAQFHVHRRAELIAATNEAHKLQLRFERARVVLAHRQEDLASETIVELDGIGREGGVRNRFAVREVRSEGARVELDRGDVLEWYVNGPLGLEQGFVLHEHPEGSGRVEIVLDVQGDLLPESSADGQSIELRDERGARLRVSELHVSDHDGSTLDSSFAVRDGKIVLAFEDTNAIYPVEIDPLYAQISEEKGPSDAQSYAEFGVSMAFDGTRVVVGAPNHGRSAAGTTDGFGAAYVFEKVGSAWQQVAKLTPGTGADLRSSRFGESVAIDGSLIAVGAPAWNISTGKVFVFRRETAGQWVLDIALGSPVASARFGVSVALNGNRLVVGRPGFMLSGVNVGSIRSYYKEPAGWALTDELHGPTGARAFGSSVASAGSFVAVGAPLSTVNGQLEQGLVYPLREDSVGSSVQFGAPLSCGNAVAAGGNCGARIAMGKDSSGREIIVAGEPGWSGKCDQCGAISVFTVNDDRFTWAARRLPVEGPARARYGAVAFSAGVVGGETRTQIAVGALQASEGFAIHVFERTGTVWEKAFLASRSAVTGDSFGRSVAIGYDQLFVGAPSDAAIGGTQAGKMYVYTTGRRKGAACTAASQCGSRQCVDGVCCATSCGGGATNDCQACSLSRGGLQDGTCTALNATTAPSITCRAAAGPCDVADKCVAGNMTCPDAVAASTVVCRAAVAGGCDVAERCTGSSATCPGDALANNATICRAAAGGCDVPERCTGSNPTCPANALASNGTTCRPVAGVCDVAETCNGSSAACPTDAFVPRDGLTCRDSVDLCDYAELCSGTSASCPPQLPPPPWCL